jgi:protein phosphatase
VQRFLIEEDGVLLLCSDGLSDNGVLERAWLEYTEPLLQGKLSLSAAVQALIDLANQENGYDNTSVVLMHCRVSSDFQLNLFDPRRMTSSPSGGWNSELSDASRALLYDEAETTPTPATAKSGLSRVVRGLATALGLLLLLVGGGTVGLLAWSQINPQGFQQFRDQLPPELRGK